MSASRPLSWPPPVLLLGLIFAGLGGLMLGFASHQEGRQLLTSENAADASRYVTAKLEYTLDLSGSRTFEEIRALPASAWWHSPGRRLRLIPAKTGGWLRLSLSNPLDQPQHGALVFCDSFQDLVEAWLPEADGWRYERSGEKVRGREKPWWGREDAFPVDLPARSQRVMYFRASDDSDTDWTVAWWSSTAALHSAQFHSLLSEGMYFGGLLALLAYNLMLWIRLRAKDIGLYVLYLSGNTGFMWLAQSMPAEFGWAFGSPALETVIVLASASSGFFLTQFAQAFLDLRARWPWAYRTTRIAAWVMGALMLGSLTIPWTSYGPWMLLTAIAIMGNTVLLLAIAIQSWRIGVRQARFFILSFGCLFAGVLPLVLSWLYFNMDRLRDAGIRSLMIGTGLEMLMLSLAIADRFVQAHRDRAAAQQQLIEEAERRRTIQEAYADELEVEVRERTRELEAITADKDRMITVLGHDLRGPLTGLTRSAEQVAVEPSEDGLRHFADEAAITGRELLLLIEDLVLWARLRSSRKQGTVCSLHALIAPAVALHQGTAKRDKIELVIDVPDMLRVKTDLVPAQTLVRNLLDNALKHARRRVEIVATPANDKVRICVRDDGPGLPADVTAWLVAGSTAPFPNTRSGLGLRLCSEISQAMGLGLESCPAPGGGAEFSITFVSATAQKEVI